MFHQKSEDLPPIVAARALLPDDLIAGDMSCSGSSPSRRNSTDSLLNFFSLVYLCHRQDDCGRESPSSDQDDDAGEGRSRLKLHLGSSFSFYRFPSSAPSDLLRSFRRLWTSSKLTARTRSTDTNGSMGELTLLLFRLKPALTISLSKPTGKLLKRNDKRWSIGSTELLRLQSSSSCSVRRAVELV